MVSTILLILNILYVLTFLRTALCDIYRLSGSVIPKHYKLKLLTSVEDDLLYTGTLEIVTQCLNVTDKIVLHRNAHIQIDKIEVKEIETVQNYKSGKEVDLKEILYSNKMEFLMISTMKKLKEDQHYLILFEFSGNLSEANSGIHRASFSTSSGISYYVISIFEPMGARKAFPCFDEPGMIATFELNIGRKQRYNTTSNMQLVKSEPIDGRDGWYWDYFLNSFPMSTYSVCFLIYDSEFTKIGNQENQIKFVVRKEKRSVMNMVTKTGPKLMAYLQKYFQMPFPSSKLDVIAVPHTLGNKDSISVPGVIIMHEKLLFHEAFNMKQNDVQNVIYDVAEELTLQWMSVIIVEWWSEVWFKTSLTKYNARQALNEISESNPSEIYEPNDLLRFFHKPQGIPFSEEVYGNLDSVVAELSHVDFMKCGLLFRMAYYLAGRTDIKDISTGFLKKNSFQRVNLQDLWRMIEGFIPQGTLVQEALLSDVMTSWLYKEGYPEIEVIRDYKSGTATLNQKKYRTENGIEGPCWWIPLIYATKSEDKKFNFNVRKWLKCPKESQQLQSLLPSDWLLLNLNVNSLYRVNYDIQNWKLLQLTLEDPISYDVIPPLNRMQLVDDLFEFTRRGNISYNFLFEFLEYLRFDHSYAPWAAFAENVYILNWRLYPHHQATTLLSLYMQNVLSRHFKNRKFVSEGDSFSNITFDVLITELSCFFELPDCLKEAKVGFRKFREIKERFHIDSPFPIDLRDIIFCYAIKYGSKDDFNFLLEAFTNSKNIFERKDMLIGLHCTKDVSLIPIKRRVSRHLEHKEEGNFQFRTEKRPLSNDIDKLMMFRSGDTQDGTSTTSLTTNSDAAFTTDTSEESSTISMETSTHDDTTTSDDDSSKSDEVGTSRVPEEPPSSSETESPNKDQNDMDSDEPDLDRIILRCEFEIVSKIFYSRIKNMDQSRSLHYIWLFTERINRKADLDHFKNFFEENEHLFPTIKDEIIERIHYVDQVSAWHNQRTDSVVIALKKNMKFRGLRSNASIKCINYSLQFFSLGVLLFCIVE